MEAIFNLVVGASKCFIPESELTDEQLEKLDNIELYVCECEFCKKAMAHTMSQYICV